MNHEMAKENLVRGYERWRIAYGTMDWTEYLQRLQGLQATGQWVKEVAKYLAQSR